MVVKLTRTLLMLISLPFMAAGVAQADTSSGECPNLSVPELRQSVGGAAQAVQAEAQRLEPPKLNMPDLSNIKPKEALRSLGSQVERAKELEWRSGANALASGAASSVAKGYQSVKENVAPVAAHCLQRWTDQASDIRAPAPDLTEQVREVAGTPEQRKPTTLPGIETGTGVVNDVRRAVVERVMPQNNIREVGSGFVDTLAQAFPTAFRIVKYGVIWIVSTSVLVTILLLIILARLGYILLFPSGRSGKDVK